MFRCMCCGEKLCWSGDFTIKEVYGEEMPDGITGIYSCDKCELDYEVSTFEDSDEIEVKFYELEK